VASGEIDDRGGGCGSPVRSNDVGRALARAGLCEMRWGSECRCKRCSKRVGTRGRTMWPRFPTTCESARALVYGGRGEGGADSAGPWHRERERERERERGRARGGNGSTTGKEGPQSRERRRARERGNRRRQPGPAGQREGEGGHAGEGVATDRWNPLVRRHGRAAWLGRARPAGLLCLFPFS
jgi:hypothetical protein